MSKVATFNHLLTDSVKPTAAVTRCRFVDAAGNQLTVAGARAYGVSIDAATAADVAASLPIACVILGFAELEVGAAVAAGALIESDNQGRGVTKTTGKVNAIAKTAGSAAGDRITALLISSAE